MDPLTHALSGALLIRATAKTSPKNTSLSQSALFSVQTPSSTVPLRLQLAAGFAAAAFPDLDFVLRLIDTLTYLNWHQGPTHSLLMLPLWAWLIAYFFSKLSHGRHEWRLFFLPACLGLAIHIAGDLITSYGLMLFAPLSTERYALPLVFVIDPWFSMIIIAGLLLSWFYPTKRKAAVIALTSLTLYIFFLWTLHEKAFGIAKNHADTHAIPYEHINVLPQPLSPFYWKIIIRQDENYHVALINLRHINPILQTDSYKWLLPKMAAAYRPVMENNWKLYQRFGEDPALSRHIREAWQHPSFKPFRAFAVFPILERVDRSEKRLCYWFYDMRFKFPELPPSFRYGLCRQDGQTDWQMERHRGLFYID